MTTPAMICSASIFEAHLRRDCSTDPGTRQAYNRLAVRPLEGRDASKVTVTEREVVASKELLPKGPIGAFP